LKQIFNHDLFICVLRNPNVPVALPEGIPTWPEFTTESDNFLEINNNNIQVITTPNKERLLKLGSLL